MPSQDRILDAAYRVIADGNVRLDALARQVDAFLKAEHPAWGVGIAEVRQALERDPRVELNWGNGDNVQWARRRAT